MKSSANLTMITSPRAHAASPPVGPTSRRRSAGTRSRATVTPMPPAVTPLASPTSSHPRRPPRPTTYRSAAGLARSAIRCSRNFLNQAMIKPGEEVADIRVEHPVHLLPLEIPTASASNASMRTTPRPKPVGEAQKVLLVDRVEHLDDGPLEDLVLQRGDAERPLPPVRLRDVHPARRARPVAPRVHAARAGPRRLPPDPARRPSHVTLSTPGAAFGLIAQYAARSRSTSTWCSSAVNRASLSLRATSRTRSSALGAPARHCVRDAFCWPCSPWPGAFPPPPPQPPTRPCSTASQVLRAHLTSRVRASQAYRLSVP